MQPRLTISRAIVLFGLVTAMGLGAVIFTSNYALSELKVGGPIYNKIKLGNDLVADILPPPEYVIEAYLEATLALHDPASLAARSGRLVQLKKEYDERFQFWTQSDLEPSIKSKLIETSHRAVQRFWTALQQNLLPALAKNDADAAAKSYAEVTSAYAEHRGVIDQIVKLANDLNVATEANATNRDATFVIILWSVSGVVLLLIGAGLFGMGLGVIKPVSRMTEVMQRLAEGKLESDIPSLARTDEIGSMARAVQVFKDSALRVKAMESEQAAFHDKLEADRKAAMYQVADGFEKAVGNIVKAVSAASAEIEAAASSLTKTAEATQGLSTTVTEASDRSSANVQSAASAAEEMASSVSEIARQVQASHEVTAAAVQQAEQTNARIAELSQSAGRIGEVVKLITAIAEQTNLLALNATIEAARAGDAGRGFAVVAAEVKALSVQTAKATEEVGAQIAQMQAATDQSVAAIKQIGGTITQISEISSAIAGAVEEQGVATREISRNVQQAALGATEVAGSISDVSRGAEKTGQESGQVHGFARSLLNESNHLKLEVEKFLQTIRAA
ncbi:MAG: chemotaxis protein [Tardiphaga sp.]|jgi:methyl-accepting chemotaxis protein|nr:chemotaxis protein [Tardiphaga sp.]